MGGRQGTNPFMQGVQPIIPTNTISSSQPQETTSANHIISIFATTTYNKISGRKHGGFPTSSVNP